MNTRPLRSFRITFDTVTLESAAHGDSAHRGFLPRSGTIPARSYSPKNPHRFTLREGVEILRAHGGHFEADSSPCDVARWVTAYPDASNSWNPTAETDRHDGTTLSLHLPRELSDASARRVSRVLARELRVYGMQRPALSADARLTRAYLTPGGCTADREP